MVTHGRKRRLIVLASIVLSALIAGQRFSHYLDTQGLTAIDFANEVSRDEPRFDWKSVDKKHWQPVTRGEPRQPSQPTTLHEETTAQTDARENTGRGCLPGMVRVKGAFRDEAKGTSTGFIERLQDGACTDWISKEFPARCRTFDKAKIAQDIASVPTAALDFCIDRYEYPNVHGQYPMIVTTWREAEEMCKASEKRLCTENEWTFACEGEEARPYPYGWTRDESACVMDRPWRAFTEGALQPRDSEKAKNELDSLWQGEPSGSRSLCRSPFGVYDLTGNVDEWTRSVNPTGYRSILKGGYWGPVRARCRPATRAHNEDFIAYQQSFRCCAESDEDDDATTDAGTDATTEGKLVDASIPAPIVAPVEIDGGTDDDRIAIGRTRNRGCSFASGSAATDLAPIALALLALRRRGSATRARRRRSG